MRLNSSLKRLQSQYKDEQNQTRFDNKSIHLLDCVRDQEDKVVGIETEAGW